MLTHLKKGVVVLAVLETDHIWKYSIRGAVLPNPVCSTFTSGVQYFHIQVQYFHIRVQYFHIQVQYLKKLLLIAFKKLKNIFIKAIYVVDILLEKIIYEKCSNHRL